MSSMTTAFHTSNVVIGRRMFRWGVALLVATAVLTAFQSVIFWNLFDFGFDFGPEPYAAIPLGAFWQTFVAIGTPLGSVLLVGGIIVRRLPESAPSVDSSAI